MAYDRADIDRVRSATNLLELVGAVTTIRRTGRSHKAVCPFHQEKTPSLSLDPGRGVYYCFGCGKKGDVFTFIQETQGLDFNEAVEMLASKAGIALTRDHSGDRQRGQREAMVEAVRRAVEFYHRLLRSDDAAGQARGYLRSRGYGSEVVDHFKVGYSPDTVEALTKELTAGGVNPQTLVDTGLSRRGRGGSLFDYFRGRLMFPIYDLRGDPVGFGARKLTGEGPKYLNSPETRLYQKARLLYGLNWARTAIGRQGRAVVVEGYTDVIGLQQAGVEEAVATCGTALGEDHFDLLRRFTEKVILAFDADQAGAGAALRGDTLRTPIDLSLDLRVAAMPEGRDPADLVQEGQVDAVKKALDQALPLLQFRLEREIASFDLQLPEGRARALKRTASLIARLSDEVARTEYTRYLARHIGTDLDTTMKEVARARGGNEARTGTVPPEESSGADRTERELLRHMLANGPEAAAADLNEDFFAHPLHREAFAHLAKRRGDGEGPLSVDGLPPAISDLIHRLALDPTPLGAFDSVFARAQHHRLDRLIGEWEDRLQTLTPGSDVHSQVWRELIALQQERRR